MIHNLNNIGLTVTQVIFTPTRSNKNNRPNIIVLVKTNSYCRKFSLTRKIICHSNYKAYLLWQIEIDLI
jgi:hypothetical protein